MKSAGTRNVILGILQWGPRSGYEIKQLVDRSTRFFWAATYSQIYPELRRLENGGLVEGRDDPENRRRRRLWQLTPSGRAALEEWLREDEEPLLETRDEGMLKFFFAAALPRAEAAELAERVQRRHERVAERLEEIRAGVYGDDSAERGFPHESLVHGIALHRWTAAWYADAAEGLSARHGDAPGARRSLP